MNGITWTLNDDGSITASGTSTGKSYIRIIVSTRDAYTLPNGTYTYSLTPTGSDYANIQSLIGSYKGNNYYKNVCAVGPSHNFANVFEWNDSDLTAVLDISVEINQANKTVNCTIYPQIELGSIATDYEPYKGSTYSVNWETEAGTVYGGYVDVVSGKLVVDWTSADMGQYDWGGDNGMFDFNLHNISPSWTRNSIDWMLCSAYKPESWNSIDYGTYSDYSIHGLVYNDVTVLRVYDSRYQTVTDFKSGVLGTQFAYELATPTEIQLTPQEIRTLLGENNIWSDSGDVEAEYPADTKMYIDTKIAEAVAAAMA